MEGLNHKKICSRVTLKIFVDTNLLQEQNVKTCQHTNTHASMKNLKL